MIVPVDCSALKECSWMSVGVVVYVMKVALRVVTEEGMEVETVEVVRRECSRC